MAYDLRSFRRGNSMTLKAFSERLKGEGMSVSLAQLSRIELGGTTSLPHAMVLSRVTGLPVETFAPKQKADAVQ